LYFNIFEMLKKATPTFARKYGSLALLTGMARLFGWCDFAAGPDDGRVVVTWRGPLTRRDQPGKPD
jgi:hypothetical protein